MNLGSWIGARYLMLTARQSLDVVPVQYELFPSVPCLKGTLFESGFFFFSSFGVCWI